MGTSDACKVKQFYSYWKQRTSQFMYSEYLIYEIICIVIQNKSNNEFSLYVLHIGSAIILLNTNFFLFYCIT